ncbi:usherin [Anguilla rostrata]|uniref:usherin n=1 Tax=Anguilla rostrata TaxID=7938 RepID=UPI0030D4C9A9
MKESVPKFYYELWFIILMAGLGLILLAIFLGLLLHKALKKPPFTRERPPLVPLPLQKRSPIGVYPPSDSYLALISQHSGGSREPIYLLRMIHTIRIREDLDSRETAPSGLGRREHRRPWGPA